MAQKETYLTPGGQKKLEEELEHLRGVRRQQVANRIQQAKEIGGTVDNAEYEEAKDEQSFVEGRILTLEKLIQDSTLIDEEKAHHASKVQIGSTVSITGSDKKTEKYTIVGSAEADPKESRISNESPVGRALLGKRVGDEVQINVPKGVLRFIITKIG